MSTYVDRLNTPEPPRVRTQGLRPIELTNLADLFAEVGLDDHAQVLREAVAQVAQITADHRSAAATLEAARADAARKIAEGDLDVLTAARSVSEVEQATPLDTTQDTLAKAARRRILGTAARYLTGHGDRFLAELDTIVGDATDTITANTPAVVGIADDTAAIRSDAAAQWQAIVRAVHLIERCHATAGKLRGLGAVSILRSPPRRIYWQWKVLPAIRTPRTTREWIDDLTDGAIPGCLTAAELVALHVDTDAPAPGPLVA